MRFALKLDMEIDLNAECPEYIEANLDYIVQHIMAEGLVTGCSTAEVHNYNHTITWWVKNSVVAATKQRKTSIQKAIAKYWHLLLGKGF
jgi:hypothetical protein